MLIIDLIIIINNNLMLIVIKTLILRITGSKVKKSYLLFFILFLFIINIYCQNKLFSGTFEQTFEGAIAEIIIRNAYQELDISIEVKKIPGARSIEMANNGELAGEY